MLWDAIIAMIVVLGVHIAILLPIRLFMQKQVNKEDKERLAKAKAEQSSDQD